MCIRDRDASFSQLLREETDGEGTSFCKEVWSFWLFVQKNLRIKGCLLYTSDVYKRQAYFCGFTNSLATLTFDGETSTISGTDKDGNVLFSHCLLYTSRCV